MGKFAMDQISGFIEALVYTQPENGFTVARLKEPKKKDPTVIVGYLPSIQPGETVTCKGEWKLHASHGYQFAVAEYDVDTPSDIAGIQKYLESGLIKGIGPVFAKKIVDRFGEKTFSILEEAPQRLREISGLGEKKMQSLIDSWKQQRSIREVMLFLRSHGVSPAFAQRIYKSYGEESIAKVKENPYRLAKEIFGIGFKMADSIALKLGFALYSPERIAAGIEFVLWELSGEGHTCYPREDLLPAVHKTLELEIPVLEKEIDALLQKELLVERDKKLWLKPFFAYEQGIAKDLLRLLHSAQAIRPIDAAKAADWAEAKLQISLAEEQKKAVLHALTDKVHIITGGPGTGKSTITNAILRVSEKLTSSILLAAPTGRAAKRMSQITRQKAFTIHALLEMDFSSGGFKRGKDNPLACDLLIIDEASMIDTRLFFSLLRAVPSHARLLLVGDVDQLPSVGPGTVLRDLIQSEAIPVTRLKEIFRQAKGSRIITNAHRINQGEFPFLDKAEKSDFHYIEAETPEAIQQILLQLVSQEIPARWHFDRFEEIQVLSPMKRGVIGADLLNEALQNLLNPHPKPLLRAGRRFHPGDKVMQIRNNYDKNVYNGDIGRIAEINAIEQTLTVAYDERPVEYDFSELEELSLCYATSIHKYQGSECPCIVIPLHTCHFKLLQRNLLYTGVTRGKKQVYLVGTKKAIALALQNNEASRRHTGLIKAVQEAAKIYADPNYDQLELGDVFKI